MAFYCNHIALHLVRSRDDFEIYGPIIMNAEIIAYEKHKDINNIQKLGFGQKRQHLHNLAIESYPRIQEIVEIKSDVLHYSLEAGLIDAAVIDVTKAILLSRFDFKPLSENDYISYSLVVRKDIIGTEIFNGFLTFYNESVGQLNSSETLVNHMGMTKEFWKEVGIKFLSLE